MPDYLAIGHICADLQADGSTRLGGTALYAALTAHRLGLSVGVLTACSPSTDLGQLQRSVELHRQASATTTVFENRYSGNTRTQLLHARAERIDLSVLPDQWRAAPLVHIAPIIDEVPAATDFGALFPWAHITATPQGWLRSVDSHSIVHTSPTLLLELPFTGVHSVILSEEDVQGDEALVQRLAAHVPTVVLTRAERGATVLQGSQAINVPAYPAAIADPTGAGDVFAAAFLSALRHDSDPIAAARLACAAAAISIEAPGATGLPTRAAVEQRVREA